MDGSKLSIKSEAGLESTDSGIDSQPVFPSTFKVVLLFIISFNQYTGPGRMELLNFRDKDKEVRRGEVTCPRSHS